MTNPVIRRQKRPQNYQKLKKNEDISLSIQTNSDAEWEQIANLPNEERQQEVNQKIQKDKNAMANHRKAVKFGINIIITKRKEGQQQTDKIRHRGANMVEQRKQLFTTTKIEYNIEPNSDNLNIVEEVEKLFKMIHVEDPTVRMHDVDKKAVLWSPDQPTPEGELFRQKFKMREQTFQKGTKNITIYFTIEPEKTINQIKYTQTEKNHLYINNIWMKPDLYQTKTESSPGYLTLVHPKITYKNE